MKKAPLITSSPVSHVISCANELCKSCVSLMCNIHLALDSLSGKAPTQCHYWNIFHDIWIIIKCEVKFEKTAAIVSKMFSAQLGFHSTECRLWRVAFMAWLNTAQLMPTGLISSQNTEWLNKLNLDQFTLRGSGFTVYSCSIVPGCF